MKRYVKDNDNLPKKTTTSDAISSNSQTPKLKPKRRVRTVKPSNSNYHLNSGGKSLSLLTQEFMSQIESTKNQPFQLGKAIGKLNVQKRRVYDITNVLQGIGYLKKTSKNMARWIGDMKMTPEQQKTFIQRKLKQFNTLIESENQLDQEIEFVTQEIQDLVQQFPFPLVSFKDLMHVRDKNVKNENLVVVQANAGTSVQFKHGKNNSISCNVSSPNYKLPMFVFGNDGCVYELGDDNKLDVLLNPEDVFQMMYGMDQDDEDLTQPPPRKKKTQIAKQEQEISHRQLSMQSPISDVLDQDEDQEEKPSGNSQSDQFEVVPKCKQALKKQGSSKMRCSLAKKRS